MKHFFKFCIHFFEKIILPYHCVMCLEMSNQRRDLCRQCQAQLPTSLYTCTQCGLAFSHNHHAPRCGKCIKQSPYFDHTLIGFNYQTPIDCWIRQFKFHKKGLYARILTEIFSEKLLLYLEHYPESKPQLLISMPLHWRRRWQRGFNQAHIITQYLHKKLNIPIAASTCVTRIKHTEPQSGLNQQARKHNINNIFSIKQLQHIKHIAIIDDVVTTGSTVNELAKQLKYHGVLRVSVWALARVN